MIDPKIIYQNVIALDIAPRTSRSAQEVWYRVAAFCRWAGSISPDTQIAEITGDKLRSYIAGIAATHAPSMLRKYIRTVNLVLAVCGSAERIDISAKHRLRVCSKLPFSHPEIMLILQYANGWIRDFFITGIYTGMRLGDIANLRWSEVDLVGGWITKSTAKTGSAVDIPILPELSRYLSEKKQSGDFVYPDMQRLYVAGMADNGRKLCVMFPDFLEKIGIQGVRERPRGYYQKICRKGCHSTRHTFAFLCAIMVPPVPEVIVGELLGHSSTAITQTYIRHVRRDDKKRSLSKYPDFGLQK